MGFWKVFEDEGHMAGGGALGLPHDIAGPFAHRGSGAGAV
jgi:hypothetical protein